MTICRYFQQGYCRFGDRCRFEHTDPDLYHQEDTSRRSNYNDYNNKGSHNAYSNRGSYNSYNNRGSYNSYNNQGSYNDYSNRGSYDDGYNRRNNSGYDNRYSYNYDRRNDYIPQENRYQSTYNQRQTSERRHQSYGPGTYESDSSYGHANKFNQNKHEWVSDDYRKQRDQQRRPEEFYNTSTPKGSINFSFRDPELERKKDHPVDLRMNEQNLVYAELIKEDVQAWELGSQWPFTCYAPIQERSNFPGFTDVSPEELRHEAYKARESNTYDSYVESVGKALQNINIRRNQLKVPSVQLMSLIEKYHSGQDISAENEVDGVFPLSRSRRTPIEEMVADESSLQQNAAASFSFKEAPKSSFKLESSFSFKLPEVESKPKSQVTNSDTYTPLDKLSSVDKEQFSASTFTLGKIPTVPPPQEICF